MKVLRRLARNSYVGAVTGFVVGTLKAVWSVGEKEDYKLDTELLINTALFEAFIGTVGVWAVTVGASLFKRFRSD